jgi:cation diffusion facilitator CzcD-associated flavoprotein CzcO
MQCEPTKTPRDVDIPALREKYRQERDKRIDPRGQKQYVRPVGEFSDAYEADPYTPFVPRDPISQEIDVAILGGGWTGILAAYHLKNAGIENFRSIDHAGDFGGVWYWNRYPGIQCDNDAYCYLPLLEETGFMPSKKYADGWEIYEYCRLIGKKYGLYEHAIFHTVVTALRWDESIGRWRIVTNRGDDIRARFVIMANGLLNIPKLPGVPGIQEFKGKMFHTARWDYEYSGGDWKNPVLDKLADKRVAIVGTGATAIQAIPYLGRYAREVYVLQRTPATVDLRYNAPTDPEWVKTLEPGWQKARQDNFHHAVMERFARGEPDLVCDFWTEIARNLTAELDAEGWPELTPEQYMARREVMDYRVMERMRQRVGAIVLDRDTAEALKPWYRFLCKRPLSNDDYYPTFNRPNVTLIDVASTRGVERMTANGFVANGVEYGIDCMIFASGFEVTSDLDRRWGIDVIEGRNGLSIYDHWAHGYKTLHGMMSHGFPNQFYTGYVQGGLNGSTTEQFSRQGYHIAYIIKEALARGVASVEPSQEAQDDWVRHIHETAADNSQFVRECTPSYFNNEGEGFVDEEGKEQFRWYLGDSYGPGWYAFQGLLRDWRDRGDLEGLVLR